MYQKYLFPYRAILLFLGIFFIAGLVQSYLWLSFPTADRNYWATDATTVASGRQLNASAITYEHPGTVVLYPMAALVYVGFDEQVAVALSMAWFIALCTAFSSLIAYFLRPQSLWWLAIVIIFIFDLRFLHATPPSAAASALTVLYFLLVWYALTTPTKQRLIFLGMCAGALLATRVDTGLFILLSSLPLLYFSISRSIYLPIIVAVVAGYLCNPHLWLAPLAYIQSVFAVVFSNEELLGRSILIEFLATFPWALISIAASVAILKQYRDHSTNVLPHRLYRWFLAATIVYTALLVPLQYHPTRYFMPFYLVWDILLPIWACAIARRYILPNTVRLTERHIEIAVIIVIFLLAPLRIFLLTHSNTQEIIL